MARDITAMPAKLPEEATTVQAAVRALLPWIRLQIERGESVDVERAARAAYDTSVEVANALLRRPRRASDEEIVDALLTGYLERREEQVPRHGTPSGSVGSDRWSTEMK